MHTVAAITVIFRQWPNGDVIALFPYVPAVNWPEPPEACESYEHIGQHARADYYHVINTTRPIATDDPRTVALRRELESIGYVLDIKQRLPRKGAIP